jgi:hypothetical protein
LQFPVVIFLFNTKHRSGKALLISQQFFANTDSLSFDHFSLNLQRYRGETDEIKREKSMGMLSAK